MGAKPVKQVKRVPCSVCGRKRYVSLPVPDPFVCEDCRGKSAPSTKPKAEEAPTGRYRDEWRNPDGTLKRRDGVWLPDTRGWLNRGRG